jgi:sugar phosphate isomerase/epimerase
MSMETSRTLDRRDFLRLAAGTAVATSVSATLGARAAGAARRPRGQVPLDKIGIQLYMVRDQMARDFEGTLAAIAEIGYATVEFAGLFGRTPEQVLATIDGLGLKAVSSHDGVDQMNSNPEEVFGRAETLGQRQVVHPFFQSPSLDAYRQLADDLNTAGATASGYGLRVGYHNHAQEFEIIDGTFPMALLIEETDPDLVDIQLDLYWAMEGLHTYSNPEAHPLELFDRAPGRFTSFHVKDGFPKEPGVRFADVGEGAINFRPIFAARARSGVEDYFVERDDAASDPEGSLGSAEDSYDNLVAQYGAGSA